MENKYVLKISGSAESPKPLEIGKNYRVVAEGAVEASAVTEKKGVLVHTATFKPIRLEVKDELGESLRLSDTRGMAEQFRSMMWRIWREQGDKEDFNEVVYPTLMKNLLKTAPDIYAMYYK